MKLLAFLVAALLAALALLSLLNWSALSAPTTLSLGYRNVDAPLGLVLLGFCAAITLASLAFVAWDQARSLAAARRMTCELQAQRELADRAEQSRFMELRSFLEGELRALRERPAGGAVAGGPRLEELEARLVARLSESVNGLAAHLAEVEDKLDRALGERGVPRERQ